MGNFSLTHLLILAMLMFFSVFFPLMALIDAAKSTSKNKILWIVIIFFFNFFGASIYWFFGRKNKPKMNS